MRESRMSGSDEGLAPQGASLLDKLIVCIANSACLEPELFQSLYQQLLSILYDIKIISLNTSEDDATIINHPSGAEILR